MGENMNVIMMCGSKQSGKTTTATAIYAYHLTQVGAIPNAQIDSAGRMSIVFNKDKNEGMYFDIDNNDSEFLEYKDKYTAKYINHVGFADELKRTCNRLFGLDYNYLTGTDEQKNSPTHIKWSGIATLLPVHKRKALREANMYDSYMTHREFMETFGTDICRIIYPECHVNSAWQRLKVLNPDIGIITDCRFANEFEFIRNQRDIKLFSIRFLRNPHKSTAASETGLDSLEHDRFNLVVPEDLDMPTRNKMVISALIDHGFLSTVNIKAE